MSRPMNWSVIILWLLPVSDMAGSGVGILNESRVALSDVEKAVEPAVAKAGWTVIVAAVVSFAMT